MQKNGEQFKFSKLTIQQVLALLMTDIHAGLSDKEVKIRQNKFGLNKLKKKETSWINIFFKQLRNPFNILFFVISFISFLVKEYENGIVIIICVLINVLSSFYQEYRTAINLEALNSYLIHMVHVLRNGKKIKINASQLVPGDILLLMPGDILPADVRFIEAENLLVDESTFTGESKPVNKTSLTLETDKPDIFLVKNIGFIGTSVVSGRAVGVVIATGEKTIMGSMFNLSFAAAHKSYLAKQISKLSFFIFFLILGMLAVIFLANLFLKGEQLNIFNFFIFSTALAITAIPEALPVVITFALSNGISILAKQKVIVKRISAIEDLGSIEVLCVDKTGTLTENILAVANIYADNKDEIIFHAVLATETSYDELPKMNKGFDSALWNFLSSEQKKEIKNYKKVKEIPFEPIRKRNTALLSFKNTNILITRGMPEEIFNRSVVSKEERQKLSEWIDKEGSLGRRILAIAIKKIPENTVNWQEKDLEFLGLISFTDPLKKTAIEAIKKSEHLDVILKILSGDTKEVCFAIAKQAHLISEKNEVISGYEFADLNEAEKVNTVNNYSVFARIDPQQKFEIIQLLQKKYYVGYLGDGVNDAPALKIADVAIAVPNATDIARDSADVILIKKSLLAIVNGIQEGRTIIINILKYVKTTLSANFGNFFAIALSTLFLHYLPMLPIQLLLLNLISDFPMIAISTDNVDFSQIKKLKKNFLKPLIITTVFLGALSSIFDFIFLGVFKNYHPAILHTGWFTFSILTELVFIFSIRTEGPFYKAKRPSLSLIFLSICAGTFTIILPYIKDFSRIFEFVKLSIYQIFIILFLVLFYFVINEIVKIYFLPKIKKI